MTTSNINIEKASTTSFISASNLLDQWNGHRRLTRRVIDAFPQDSLFDYSIGGMRPFADMIKELLDISAPGVRGIATGEWANGGGFDNHSAKDVASSKDDLLTLWDASTHEINFLWSQLSEEKFLETVVAFGMYEGTVYSTILYLIDNEIHHRGQGTVYLRSLGIEPPAFWNRD